MAYLAFGQVESWVLEAFISSQGRCIRLFCYCFDFSAVTFPNVLFSGLFLNMPHF